MYEGYPMKKLIILILCLAILGLGIATWNLSQQGNYYDNNVALASESESYGTVQYAGSYDGNQRYNLSILSINGARTIWRYDAQEEGQEVTLSCTLEELGSGTAKLVFIDPDGSVTTLAEASSGTQQAEHTFSAEKGLYRIKIVGKDSAKINTQLYFSHGIITGSS